MWLFHGPVSPNACRFSKRLEKAGLKGQVHVSGSNAATASESPADSALRWQWEFDCSEGSVASIGLGVRSQPRR